MPTIFIENEDEIEAEISALAFLESLRGLSASKLQYLTAEDIFSMLQEISLISSNFFDMQKWRSHRQLNPDVIVGETDTSTDKNVRGTVSSRKVWTHPVIWHGPEKVLVNYFNEIYTEAESLKKEVRKENFFLTNFATRGSIPTFGNRSKAESALTKARKDKKIADRVAHQIRKNLSIYPPDRKRRIQYASKSKQRLRTPRKKSESSGRKSHKNIEINCLNSS